MWLKYTMKYSVQFSSVQSLSCVWLFATPWTHARPLCPSPTPGTCSNSCPSSRWCHPATLSFVIPFSSCPQSLPASWSFPMNQLFAWGGQSIGVSASASVLLMKYYSATKKNEIMPFIATRNYHTKWSKPEKTNIRWYSLYVELNKKMIKMNSFSNRNRLRHRKQTWLPKEKGREGIN